MVMNVAFEAMYIVLGWSDLAAVEVVETEGINTLRLLGSLKVDRVKSSVKDICCTGKKAVRNAVSETAEHHLIVRCFICKHCCRYSCNTKTMANLVTTGDLFEVGRRRCPVGGPSRCNIARPAVATRESLQLLGRPSMLPRRWAIGMQATAVAQEVDHC